MDWESIELLWRHAFYDRLNLPEDSASPSVLLTESPLAPSKHREQCVQVMFESLHVQALCLKVQAALSLFSLGRSTGCVLESGLDLI
jgi:actin-related protein